MPSPHPDAPDPHRLPRSVLPHRYDLELAPDLDAATFRGAVGIEVEVVEPTDTITLNALGLDIDAAWVRVDGSDRDAAVEVDADLERLTLVLPARLGPGTAEVHLSFRGRLDDGLAGFYRSTFTTPDPDDPDGPGTEHAVAVTQFESTHARQAFPCFDEPDLKATFAISLVVADGLLAVSNAAEVSRTPAGDGTVRICFAETMRMSTYLVAVVVGPLEVTEPRMVPGAEGPIPLRVVHPPGAAHLTGFALDVADAGIRFFEEYYGLPYPGDKVDLVAVPDFAFGAMENLGCITFREVLLLVDTDAATRPELQRIADVVNHELAHMWFGDLVTMRWWNGIWLNEAFATFMEVAATDAFRPDWDVWTTFGLARAGAFDTDALASTRPIEYEVVTPADAEGMFDVLTYEKGASVVRMLEQYLGPDRFRDGIRSYLRRHAYDNTETSDLWDALEAATGEPVRRIMDAWIFTGGHPLVTVEATNGGLRLAQEPFRYLDPDRAGTEPAHGGARWPVPLVVTAEGGATRRVLLEDPVTLEVAAGAGWVQANTGGAAFVRTLPDAAARAALAAAGRPPLERFVLVDDAWAAVLAGRLEPDGLVELVRTVAVGEGDTSVWRRLAGVLRSLHRLGGPGASDRVSSLVRDTAGPVLERLGEPADDDGRDLRGVLVSLLGTVGEDAALRSRARDWFDDESADPALRAAALDVVAATATDAEHAEIEHRWRTATTPQRELRHLEALADTPEPAAFDRLLELAVTEVRPQNAPYLLRRALTNDRLGGRAWDAVSADWDRVVSHVPSSALPRMLEGVRAVTDADRAASVRAFLSEHPLPSGERTVRQHLERMDVNVAAAARVRAAWAPGDRPADGPGPG